MTGSPEHLLDRFARTRDVPEETLDEIRRYLDWQVQRRGPGYGVYDDDDIDIRSYVLDLRAQGESRRRVHHALGCLKRFYAWAVADGLIPHTPFTGLDVDRPFLSGAEVRRRGEVLSIDPAEREVARLRALNHVAGTLNRSPDLNTLFAEVLQELAAVMKLRTA